ncbi:hypothetical protein U14_01427 [Candidatus Moduliflexus flocculans]|uniref:O-antigen ligase-related domain-containing protein n=1 Tax=Candidatus Moduliflexus flocculans TaxID=1499966 RepID=A0A0S6VS18_9BACT|nr:hypothetical protein U14_01427 [Candidatus Moduliflexus flocculans]
MDIFFGQTLTQRILFIILLLLILIVPFDEAGNDYIGQAIAQLLLLGGWIFWAIQTLRRGKVTFVFDRIDGWILAGLLWCLVSLSRSEYKYATVLELIKIFSYVAVFYLGRALFPFRQARMAILLTILASSVIQAIVGWGLFLTHHTQFLQADLVNANIYSCFLLFGVNIAFSILLFGSQHLSETPRRMTFLLIGLSSVFLCFLVFTLFAQNESRSAFISLIATGLFLTAFRSKRLMFGFLAIGIVLIFLPFSEGSVFQRLQKRNDPYAYERVSIWKSDVKMVRDHPIFGVGLGMFEAWAKRYNFPVEHAIARYGKNINEAHSDLLQIAAETGITGVGIVLGGLVLLFWRGWRALRFGVRDWPIMATLSAIIGVLVQGLFANLLLYPAIPIILIILATLLTEHANLYRQKTLTFRASWRWYLLLGLIGGYILIWPIGYPLLGHVHYLRSAEAMQRKDRATALKELDRALEYIPIHANYHYDEALMFLEFFQRGHDPVIFSQAEQAFQRAIQANSVEYIYHESLGLLYQEQFYALRPHPKSMALKALNSFQNAIKRNPFNTFIYFTTALLYGDINEYERAAKFLQQAISLEPNFIAAHQLLSKCYEKLGRNADAETALRHANELREQYRAYTPQSHYEYTLLRPLSE